jgi:hypothetical protein
VHVSDTAGQEEHLASESQELESRASLQVALLQAVPVHTQFLLAEVL